MAHVALQGITKKFRRHKALDALSLEVGDGEFFVLLGPTGAGKTTTLRLIAGLDGLDAGSISIGGKDVAGWSAAERDVALVFQYYSLYPHYTVRQNLEFPLRSKHRHFSPEEIQSRVAKAAKTLRIEHLLERKTDRLSGGEMQRVSIGRAIVREPRVFLMDEPLSNLDAKLREVLRAELKDLQMKLGATFLYVTHDQVEAMSMGDKIGILNHGRIVQRGTPQQIYNQPRDTFVATFVGTPAMNLIHGNLHEGRMRVVPGRFEIALDAETLARLAGRSGPVTLGVRSEDVQISAAGAAITQVSDGVVAQVSGGVVAQVSGGVVAQVSGGVVAQVSAGVVAQVYGVENHGVEKIVTLRVADHVIKATVPARTAVQIDGQTEFSFNQRKLQFFDRASGASLFFEERGHG